MADKAKATDQAEQGTTDGFWAFLVPILGAIASGISVIGFVVFFGGMVAWARFEAVGLPANSAVSRVARNELVATGASFLVPAVLASLVAVAAAGLTAYAFSLGRIAA